MSTARRPPPASAIPKAPLTLPSQITLSDLASITGTRQITLKSHTVIHPRAKLVSAYGTVTIGQTCIVSERCSIGLLSLSNSQDGVQLADSVIVEVRATVEGITIGEGTVVETNAHIHPGAIVGRFCRIGAHCEVFAGEVVEDRTVIFGEGLRRVDEDCNEDQRLRHVRRQIEVLRRLVGSKPEKFM